MQPGIVLTLVLQCLLLVRIAAATSSDSVVNVVLLGATGNLAKKYLWQGLYNIWEQNLLPDATLAIYPAATKNAETSVPLLELAFEHNITASSLEQKDAFLEHIKEFVQLREPVQYEHLAKRIEGDMEANGLKENGRLFYLSVPPKFFGSIAERINSVLRPLETRAWLRVIIEKPFGTDLESAKSLAADLERSLKQNEIFLVDHYMGKPCVRVIPWFRARNRELDSVLHSSEVEDIEIQMLETEDVAGRTGFYDEVGVVRDVVQNHLTLVLSLLTMGKTPGELEPVHNLVDARVNVLKDMKRSMTIAYKQYRHYADHLTDDFNKYRDASEMRIRKSSNTPTFVAVEVEIQNERWNTPVRLVAGKALHKRQAGIVIRFRSGDALIINIQGEFGHLKGCSVLATKDLPPLKLPYDWERVTTHHYVAPSNSPSAYQTLLLDALKGQRESFVALEEVLLSWKLWDQMLKVSNYNLETYETGAWDLLPTSDLFSTFPSDNWIVGLGKDEL